MQQAKVQLRPFELGIIKDYQAQGSISVSPKSEWIRGHLGDVGQDYGTGMFKRWSLFCELSSQVRTREDKLPRGIRQGTHGSFATYMWVLQKLQLIKLNRILPVRPNVDQSKQRHYYELNKDKLTSQAWKHPLQVMYPSSDWKKMGAEKRAYYRRKWKTRRIKKRLGRPPKN